MSHTANLLASLFGVSSDSHAVEALVQKASIASVPGGTKLFASGDVCESFLIIAGGTARVQLATRSGRGVTLFRLKAGQACALTTSCLLSETSYYAEGVAETDLEFVSIPSSALKEALSAYPEMMQALLRDYAGRIAEMTGLVDRLTSRDLNAELANLLLARRGSGLTVQMSHQNIATELGSAREVISRKLKDWENRQLIELGRGSLRLRNIEQIEKFCR